MFNAIVHGLLCRKCSRKRTNRQDAVAKTIHEDIFLLTCNSAHLEPFAGADADSDKRPDIKFRNTMPSSPSSFISATVEGYTCSDITFITIRNKRAVEIVQPPEADSVWAEPRDEKFSKHTRGSQVCNPAHMCYIYIYMLYIYIYI